MIPSNNSYSVTRVRAIFSPVSITIFGYPRNAEHVLDCCKVSSTTVVALYVFHFY